VLESCSSVTLAVLGVQKGTEGSDVLIDTFDPFSGTNGRWHKHSLSTSRNISKFQSLLYRASNVSSAAIDMKMEIDKLISEVKPRKRPMDTDPFNSPSPTKRRLLDTTSIPMIPSRAIKLETSESSNHLSEPLIVSSDSESSEFPQPVKLILKRSKQVDLSQNSESSRLSRAKQDTVELSSEDEDDEVQANQASSLHASWPLKYVVFESPVRSGLWASRGLDRDRDRSSPVQRPQKTALNRHRPVLCGLMQSWAVTRPVSTSYG